jgi:hypothetical protein
VAVQIRNAIHKTSSGYFRTLSGRRDGFCIVAREKVIGTKKLDDRWGGILISWFVQNTF